MSIDERKVNGVPLIEGIEGYIGFRLTNRIRLNSELYTFIKRLMSYTEKSHTKSYPSVVVAYANNDSEADILLRNYIDSGYTYIYDDRVYPKNSSEMPGAISAMSSTCKEYDKVLMLLDNTFTYDREGYLRGENDECVRNIFHGLSRAKQGIAIIIKDNTYVFNMVLSILQK